MVYFTEIRKTDHYRDEHEHEVPFYKVFEIISLVKNPRKKGNVYEIEQDGYYIVFSIRKKIVRVINAKKCLK